MNSSMHSKSTIVSLLAVAAVVCLSAASPRMPRYEQAKQQQHYWSNFLMDLSDHVTLASEKEPIRKEDWRFINEVLAFRGKSPELVSVLAETLFQTIDQTRPCPDFEIEEMKSLLATEQEIAAALFLMDACYDGRGWQKLIPESCVAELLPLAHELSAVSQEVTLIEREMTFRRVLSTTLHEPLLSMVTAYLLVFPGRGAMQEDTPAAVFRHFSSEPRLRRHGIRLLTLEKRRFWAHREELLRLLLQGENERVEGGEFLLSLRAVSSVSDGHRLLEEMGSRTFTKQRMGDVVELTDVVKERIRRLGVDPNGAEDTFLLQPTNEEAFGLYQRCSVRVGFRAAEDRLAYVMECVRKGEAGPPFSEALLLGSRHFPEEFLLHSLEVLAVSTDRELISKTQTSLRQAGRYVSVKHELYPRIVAQILAMAKERNFSTRAILADTVAAMGCPEPFVLPLLAMYKDSPGAPGYRKYLVDSHVVESLRQMPKEELVKTFQSILRNPGLEPYYGTIRLLAAPLKIPEQELE